MNRFKRYSSILMLLALCLAVIRLTKAADNPNNATNMNNTNNTVIVNMTASIVKKTPDGKYYGGWVPQRIVVHQGQHVILKIKSLDATHMFSLSGYNIQSQDINPGNPVEISFTADKAGIFEYACKMYCGPYHTKMKGQLVVDKN